MHRNHFKNNCCCHFLCICDEQDYLRAKVNELIAKKTKEAKAANLELRIETLLGEFNLGMTHNIQFEWDWESETGRLYTSYAEALVTEGTGDVYTTSLKAHRLSLVDLANHFSKEQEDVQI